MKTFLLSTVLSIVLFTSCKTENSTNISTEIDAIENGLQPAIQVKGDSIIQFHILERMKYHNVPGVSIAIVQDGKLKWAKGYGISNTNNGNEVTVNTIFQAGSISKPVAALSALKLVEEGNINLDQDVNTYLKEWKVPDSEFTKDEKVTLRRLLTHTAGMTVHGFPGYQQKDTFPSITKVLNGKGNTAAIYVDTIPSSIWRYSGGGYTVMEKLVEDISGLSLDEYMDKNILQPIGMKNSTYQQPLGTEYHSDVSAAYDGDEKIIEGLWHNYPEQAAAGLWTTPTDLAMYCIEIQEILSGKENGILSKETIEKMLTKHKNDWGLGPSLQWENDSLIFRHGGKNAGFTNELVSFANRGDAVIIMTNADNGGRLIGEVLRSVSKYYDWGISNPRVVETIDLPIEKLNELVGQYKLNFQVPDIGDYLVDVSIKNNKLFVFDPNNNDTNILTALEELKFIDLSLGDEVEFQISEDTGKVGFLWSGRFQFYKIDE